MSIIADRLDRISPSLTIAMATKARMLKEWHKANKSARRWAKGVWLSKTQDGE